VTRLDRIITSGRRLAESSMLDGLYIARNPNGTTDDVLDTETGELVRPSIVIGESDTLNLIYDESSLGDEDRSLAASSGVGGMGRITAVDSSLVTEDDVHGRITERYRGAIPIDGPTLKPYDYVAVMSSNNPKLVYNPETDGPIFFVRRLIVSTFSVSQSFMLEEVTYALR
jgi:hypothetical protein